jgi:hypothetical protein
MSTGRLLAFGFYGPLDADARLRSGHKGSHVVGRWELDTMCRQVSFDKKHHHPPTGRMFINIFSHDHILQWHVFLSFLNSFT